MNPEEQIFEAATALPAADRPAYLDQACAGQPELRARIEALLRSHEVTGFMEHPTVVPPGPPTEQPGDLIGRYKLMEKIGEGGFGVVWVAEQQEPVRRRVALKIIKPGMDSREVIARFEQERQALAMMDHPNIAKVFDAGATDKGRPFFVMELVRGVRITDYCDQASLPTAERLSLFINVCQAVQHAHQKGIIHRDLKPSNILVTPGDDGEPHSKAVPALNECNRPGRPDYAAPPVVKVIDFGVAKAIQQQPLTDGTAYTQFEQMIGTPAYMSPEQAGLGPMDIDTRSDVYSLGVLLYELLTGRPPFDSKELLRAGMDEMRRVIREVEPPRPSTRRTQMAAASIAGHHPAKSKILIPKSKIPADLDWIVMKALEKDRARRYESAAGLVADLRRHMESLPVLARPPGRAYLLSRFIRRHKIGVAAGLAVSLSLFAGLGAVLWGKKQAEEEAKRTRLANEANERNLHLASMADYAAAVKALDEDLEATRKGQRALGFKGKSRWHEGVALLVRALEREPGNRQAALELYDTLRRRQGAKRDWALHILKQEGPVRTASFSPDGTRIFTVSNEGTARLWDTDTGQPIGEPLPIGKPMPQHGRVNADGFSPDGTRIVTVSDDGSARLWDAATAEPVGEPMRHKNIVDPPRFSFDGSRLVTTELNDEFARVWNSADGRLVGEPMRHPGIVETASFSPDGTLILTTCTDGTVRLWDAESSKQIGHPMRHRERLSSATFSPDGSIILSVERSGNARIWEVASGREIRQLTRPDGLLQETRATFSPDGTKILAIHKPDYAGPTRGVRTTDVARIWDVATGIQLGADIPEIYGRWDGGGSFEFCPDGTMVVTATGVDMTTRVWDAATGDPIGQPIRHNDSPNTALFSANFSPDATLIVTGGDYENARLWEARSGWPISLPLRHENRVWDIMFSPDGTKIITIGDEVKIWEVPSTTRAWDDAFIEYGGYGRMADWASERAFARAMTPTESAAIVPITPAILDWARSFSGLSFDEEGQLHLISDVERLSFMAAISLPDGPWADLIKWINIPSRQRSIDPKLSVTFRQIAERYRDKYGTDGAENGNLSNLEHSLALDSTVPLTRLLLAAALEKRDGAKKTGNRDPHIPQRAAFLRRYDLDALDRQKGKLKDAELAALWARAAAHLFKLPPETKVGIGPKTTTAREEAEKAARKALELVSGLPEAEEVLKKIEESK